MTEGVDMAEFNKQIVASFRESCGVGEMGPVQFEHLVLLTTTGRRSGEPRTVPLGSARDDQDNLLLLASNMGAPQHLAWYLNLTADPRVRVEITGASWDTEAVVLDGAAREAAYRRWIETAPHVAAHQEKAGREIPMVRIPSP